MKMVNWIDEKPGTVEGTPVNRKNLMDMQGFNNYALVISEDGNTITQTSEAGTLVTNINGSTITETFTGADGKAITQTTTIDGLNIEGAVS